MKINIEQLFDNTEPEDRGNAEVKNSERTACVVVCVTTEHVPPLTRYSPKLARSATDENSLKHGRESYVTTSRIVVVLNFNFISMAMVMQQPAADGADSNFQVVQHNMNGATQGGR